jgi:NAD-dependent deacetylase
MAEFRHIVILTGSGLSAESGIATFRDRDGIWAKYDFNEVATPEGFRANPQLVHDFYNQRRRGLLGAAPNAAHFALARLEREHKGSVTVITQNIDHLHEAAGSRDLIHMHGELLKALCALCGARHAWTEDLGLETQCPGCERKGGMRPDVVWFGEVPHAMDRIYEHLIPADLFISIGTSGNVYPAAGFVAAAREAGARTVELNLEPSDGAHLFHEAMHGPATQIVPAYVERLLYVQ